ncbi:MULTISPECIES: metal ABC transporter substrate-binding protein [unclassified Leifsonia]|uniref:metal ABC transporter substrate-binding protein n=1 Tax=unclassified Leifsonia TaxID=2663824 RepID=UPI00190FF1F1|nr:MULTISPECIES: metal ABC transporter substrate-binding protein [unclassified Leifsonia]
MKRRIRLTAALATAIGATLLLAGCIGDDNGVGGVGAQLGTLKVVATTTQVADFTREVAGDGASVTQLIQPNQSAHSYDPSAADLMALSRADVLVQNGAGLEEWLDDAVEASGFSGVTVDASTGIELDETDSDADSDHADETEAEHADEADDHGHDHAAGNPHIWTDPKNAEQMVETITTALSTSYPAKAADFRTNADAYIAKLTALDDWSRTNIDTVPEARRLFVSNHDAFSYFVDAYDIDYVGSVIPSFDDSAEPSAAEIDELVADIKATGTKAVFSETSLSPKTANTIAKEAGVEVYSGDDALYGDSLGPADSDGATYIAAQLHNVRMLLQSWGVTPTALPASLQE